MCVPYTTGLLFPLSLKCSLVKHGIQTDSYVSTAGSRYDIVIELEKELCLKNNSDRVNWNFGHNTKHIPNTFGYVD